jgi:PhoH-like ATPase
LIEEASSEKNQFGKSLKVLHVSKECMDRIHTKGGKIEVPEELDVYPNQPLVMKNQSSSCLAFVSRNGKLIEKADQEVSFFNIKGRNKEQKLLMNLLRDKDIRLVVITGPAGTGKTTLVGAHLLDQVLDKENYEQMILSKPLEIVTRTRYWGTVPGDEDEKFDPFLKSYQIMFEDMVNEPGGTGYYIEQAMENGKIDFLPLELMRGASLKDCICWYDEAQNLNYHECNSLGSRIDDEGDSKLILSGDLNQRDRNIDRHKTGLMKVVTDKNFLESPLTAHIDLIQNERGEISQLFHEIFDED